MQKFLGFLSSRTPAVSDGAADGAAERDGARLHEPGDSQVDDIQPSLTLDGEPLASESTTRAAPRRGARALRQTAFPSTSVAVRTMHPPVVPNALLAASAAPVCGAAGSVVLTETERVRLRIMQSQIRLARLSLYEGPIDGMLTLETATSIRYFQTLKGLRESGQLTAATLRALGVPA
jgi:hypothetical protein